MKTIRLGAALLALAVLLAGMAMPASAASEKRYSLPEDTTVHAQSAIVVALGANPEDDQILFERDADVVRAPGAMVRIAVGMTALAIIEEEKLDIDKVTGTYTESCRTAIAGTQLATVGMNIGEVWTLRDLLIISMITTAADAAQTLAVTLCESERDFVKRMNEWAADIGCTDTSFYGVHGLDHGTQTTTAKDMYRILRAAVGNSYMEQWLSTTSHRVKPVKKGLKRTYSTVNEMIKPNSSEYYAATAFGRSGYTTRAGRCMAAVARAEGYEYLVVAMGCPQSVEGLADGTSHFADTRTLFRWAFRNFAYRGVIGKGDPVTRIPVNYAWATESVTLVAEKNLTLVVPDGMDVAALRREVVAPTELDAPLQKGERVGVVRLYTEEDLLVGEVGLITAEGVRRSAPVYGWERFKAWIRSPWVYGGAALVGLLLVGYVALSLYHNEQRKSTGNKRVKFK